jgi:hypothetical protein
MRGKEFGETSHEDAASGYRLRDRNGFCLSGVRYSVLPEQHLAAWPLCACATYDE